ncbi:uncharacterized protein LOC105167348 [Sesamum indicum]|uniref:Uncharacterized protein LOC105167348 n=1 Tax=Sesamum indicum TaxID=4182 RepID=A0A6I9TIC4_SESIN|nr:uncharacterized protein LOC105167348 [Sesamum indicum]
MGSRLQRRMALRRKLHILRTLTKSKSVKKRWIIRDAFVYMYKLKLQVEAMKREYECLQVNEIEEVKVEEVGNDMDGKRGLLMVRVGWKGKGEEVLVSMLEAFERMNVNVVEARVTSNHFFGMEAIVQPPPAATAPILNQAILNLLQTQNQNY